MGSIDKDEEYAACMLATVDVPEGKHEVMDPPIMDDGTPPVIRVCDPATWLRLKSHDIETGMRVNVATAGAHVVTFNGVHFHLSWIRAVEASHGPLSWAMSVDELTNVNGDRGRFIAGYKGGKRVAMVAQYGFS